MLFLSSDGASVNCGKHSGLIKLFQENYPWVSFVWCFGHRLELALKDTVREVRKSVDMSLRDFYYLHAKSSMEHRKLKILFNLLEDQFETYSAGVRPMKATGTRWIDHKTRAMDSVVGKFDLYTQYLSKPGRH